MTRFDQPAVVGEQRHVQRHATQRVRGARQARVVRAYRHFDVVEQPLSDLLAREVILGDLLHLLGDLLLLVQRAFDFLFLLPVHLRSFFEFAGQLRVFFLQLLALLDRDHEVGGTLLCHAFELRQRSDPETVQVGQRLDHVADINRAVLWVPAVVIGDHCDRCVANLGFPREFGFGHIGHADDVAAPRAVKMTFGLA